MSSNDDKADEDAVIEILKRRESTVLTSRLPHRVDARRLIDALDAVRTNRNPPEGGAAPSSRHLPSQAEATPLRPLSTPSETLLQSAETVLDGLEPGDNEAEINALTEHLADAMDVRDRLLDLIIETTSKAPGR